MLRGENNKKREKQVSAAGIDIPALMTPILPQYFAFLERLLTSDRYSLTDHKWACGQLTKIVSRMTPQTATIQGTGDSGAIIVQWKTNEDSNN